MFSIVLKLPFRIVVFSCQMEMQYNLCAHMFSCVPSIEWAETGLCCVGGLVDSGQKRLPEQAEPCFERLGLHTRQPALPRWVESELYLKNRLLGAKRNKPALFSFRVRECFVVALCRSDLLLHSWVSSFSVFQQGCNTWKHAVWGWGGEWGYFEVC